MKKIAVVTGANRGLGYETVRQLGKKGYTVVLAARDPEKGETAAAKLRDEKLDVHFHALDVTSAASINQLKDYVTQEFGRCDVLVNNAGVFINRDGPGSGLKTSVDNLRKTFETNLYGPYQLMQAFGPLMVKNNFGRIVNVSSGMGQLSEMEGSYPGYRTSKAALNALTRIFSADLSDKNILVNSICPGWVKTDMGGTGAEREIPEGADTIVWAATLPDGSPTGSFFRDREKIEW
jgi:NAD(P)-dependent dehydrogenase (short-subunit alcohol dehydrogenase family)